MICKHKNVTSDVCDQTLGVVCIDCNTLIAYCWGDDEHIPESLWNRTCRNNTDSKLCEQNRDNYCALCGEQII